MTRWGVIVAVLAVAGCDKLLGVNDYDEPSDAPVKPIDAAPVIPCKDMMPKPPLCADFDETPAAIYVNGTASAWPLTATGVVAEARGPANAGIGALWITDNGGTYTNVFDPQQMATTVKAAFDFTVDTQSMLPNTTGLMRIAFQNSGHNSCYANFLLDQSVPTLRVNGACGTTDAHGEILIPLGWVHVEFTFDLSGDVVATLKVNDTVASATFFVGSGTPDTLHYTVQVGIDGPALPGMVVAYDSLVVTSQ